MKKWSGDHCASDPKDTGGIFFSNRQLESSGPSIMDIAPTVLDLLDVKPAPAYDGHSLTFAPTSKSGS
jgi:bisphosphoglycerate-independent phosphoglycerate mutase (AlkP superfamily)